MGRTDTNISSYLNYSWEHPNYPFIYFPREEVPQKYLKSRSDDKDTFDVVVGSRTAEGAVKVFEGNSKLSGLLKIEFWAMDAWFEEDEQIFVHPKDPYKVRHTTSKLHGSWTFPLISFSEYHP